MENIAAAIQHADKAPKDDAGCKTGQDDRASDLCAQWKAADAASDSAWWSSATFWLGVVGTIVGGGTLLAAGYAAWYAKEAATHTETGAAEARRGADAAEAAVIATQRIGEAQVRSYVIANEVEAQLTDANELSIECIVHNYGQSPATQVHWVPKAIMFLPKQGKIRNLSLQAIGDKNIEGVFEFTVAAQSDETLVIRRFDGFFSSEDMAAIAADNFAYLSVDVAITATDVFEKITTTTAQFTHIFRSCPVNYDIIKIKRGSVVRHPNKISQRPKN